MNLTLAVWRCRSCNRKLGEQALERGAVSVKCERCGKVNLLTAPSVAET